ncbi:DEAD/DEAH box helicase [Zooshikella sp. RANM57]|uniref:DEAD/DEAH box helicase n=1 Tax=Zooshikella sp. RANM57 TaxID=3425863 RepID=UPI003D6F058D
MSVDENSSRSFHDLNLIPPVLRALDDVGYETPSPIQAQVIPHVMSGQDVIGQAQTGTGKTAAFALPLLSRINLELNAPQVLVLAPTRELAIQVAEAFQRYAAHMKGFHVLPIYGGQEYRGQLRQLKRGAHVVVGTPGRVVDHIKRGTLQLNKLQTIVLDEADEMLRMGFIDDVEWVLEQTPAERQIALFSATMPNEIRRIAQRHLVDPTEVAIKVKTTTVDTIRQRYWLVSGVHKLDALTRMLEAEPFDGMIIFVRTKTATLELAEKLEARGFASAPLNGDIPQQQREKTVDRLKAGKLDILVATDVVARGLDVPRISHVINFDIPYDIETYVHRIGRTGRAGRKGEAILFVAPREKRMLHSIERATRQRIEVMELPSTEIINDQRISRFKQRITDTIAEESLEFFLQIVTDYQQEHNVPAQDIAAALAKLVQGDEPLLLKPEPKRKQIDISADKGMERYRIAVGHQHGVKPNNIVGAIANEANISSKLIGRIDIQEQYSTVDLPAGLPQDILKSLKKTLVCGQQLKITLTDEVVERSPRRRKPSPKKGKPNSGSPAGKPKKKRAPRKEKRSS